MEFGGDNNVKTMLFAAMAAVTMGVVYADATADGAFANPVIARDWPDPAFWRVGTSFYSVATGLRTIYRSENAIDWKDTGIDPLAPEARRKLGEISNNWWAPCVLKLKDRWMLYISLFVSDADCRIVALSSSSPTGPFAFCGEVIDSRTIGILNTIDPYVVRADGKVWMFFGSCQDGVHRVELTDDGSAIRPGSKPAHVAGPRNPRASADARGVNIWGKPGTVEGSFLLRRRGWWYLFVSGGKYNDHTYYLTVGRSRSIDGEFLDREGASMKEGKSRPILSSAKGDTFYGPGHNGEVVVSDDGRDFIYFHSHAKGHPPRERPTFLQELKWSEDGWPHFADGRPQAEERRFHAVRLSND